MLKIAIVCLVSLVSTSALAQNRNICSSELPGCSVGPRYDVYCCNSDGSGCFNYTGDGGCSITCPATKTPVCLPNRCDGGVNYVSSCVCTP